jgi:prolyl oligopeptidase PreP (S9A serine peptidase family)
MGARAERRQHARIGSAAGLREDSRPHLSILNSKDRIPAVAKHGKFLYNFWRDEKNVRGLWRRTTLDEYRKPEPKWETVIDLDQLGAAEKENWVWKFARIIEVTHDRALVSLSRGGADATVVREFDLKQKAFVTNGFYLPEAKSRVDYRDRDTLFVGTDFGPGSLTKSGYPRIIKEWKRGTPLSARAQRSKARWMTYPSLPLASWTTAALMSLSTAARRFSPRRSSCVAAANGCASTNRRMSKYPRSAIRFC